MASNSPIDMHCDNTSALIIAYEPGVQRGVRYYARQYHYVRKQIELSEINYSKFTQILTELDKRAEGIGLKSASYLM